MNNQPANPAAIVEPAFELDAEMLATEAAQFGRKTVEAAIAAGRALVRSQAAWKGKSKDWFAMVGRKGFSRSTAQRLMIKARNAQNLPKMGTSLDAIYDDGQPRVTDTGKLVCRQCRIRGRKYDPKCRGCRALNRPAPKPEKTPEDMDGKPLPEKFHEAWHDTAILREWGRQVAAMGKALEGMIERPGGKAINVTAIQAKLKSTGQALVHYRIGLVCDKCGGDGCGACADLGWKPVVVVRDERARAKALEWKNRQAASADPLPE